MKFIVCCAIALVACGFSIARAQDCCDQCGCQSCCQKVCRLVCETKKVPKVTYSCECEDFCVPGPSDHCVVCDECGNKKHIYTPTCAHVRTRKKLIKHETMEEVPSYRWVVENVCNGCVNKCAAQGGGEINGITRLPLDSNGVRKASFQAAPTGASADASQKPTFTGQIRGLLTPAFGQK